MTMIAFSVCVVVVALMLFAALMRSQAHTLLLVLGGAILGGLIGGAVALGVPLYVTLTHNSYAGLGIFELAQFMAAAGAFLGALVGAGYASGREQ